MPSNIYFSEIPIASYSVSRMIAPLFSAPKDDRNALVGVFDPDLEFGQFDLKGIKMI